MQRSQLLALGAIVMYQLVLLSCPAGRSVLGVACARGRTRSPSQREIARQLARHVAKILTGMKAGDLPIERPMKLELVINLKIAKQIGVTIPSEVLMQANKLLR